MKSRTLDATRYKQKRGQGILGDYIPWFLIHEISSRGVSWRVMGLKTGRIHHLLSTLEKHVLLFLDSMTCATDIREQYPLNLNVTRLIAAESGIKHPRNGEEFYTMTTDFLVDFGNKQIAIAVKPMNRLNKRTIQKFEIEYAYWQKLGIEWLLLTENEIRTLPFSYN